MSYNWLKYIPVDPNFVPGSAEADKAVEVLKRVVPNAGDEVRAIFSNHVEFHDCGSNWSGVRCPHCGEDVEDWWISAVNTAYKSGFEDLRAATPCCKLSTSLNDVTFVWPAGFARFALEVRNPNIAQTTEAHDRELSDALGFALRKIWRHL